MTYNGPALSRWLLDQPEVSVLSVAKLRTIRGWQDGIDPPEPQVDALLCEVGLHLRDVPPSAVTGWPEVAVSGLEVEWNPDGTIYLARAA